MSAHLTPAAEADRQERARQILEAVALLAAWRDKLRHYHTTRDDCRCPDRQYRGVVCKHMRVLRLMAEAEGGSREQQSIS